MGAGNWTPAAEFNIWVDPEAARIVFRSGLPITMCGLDVTHKALMGLPEVDRLGRSGRAPPGCSRTCSSSSPKFHVERYGTADTPIHDAVAVAHVALPGHGHDRAATTWTSGRRASSPGAGRWSTTAASRARRPTSTWRWTSTARPFADLVVEAVASYR